MTIHLLALILAVLIIVLAVYRTKTNPESKLSTARFLALASVVLTVCYIFGIIHLKDQVNYRKVGEAPIFRNQADQEYYFKHDGRVIALMDACFEQYPTKVPPSRVNSISNVTIYERTYLPTLGLTYGGKDIMYVHGYDARIDQSIELK